MTETTTITHSTTLRRPGWPEAIVGGIAFSPPSRSYFSCKGSSPTIRFSLPAWPPRHLRVDRTVRLRSGIEPS